MADRPQFTFSDALCGQVTADLADGAFELTTMDGGVHRVELGPATAPELLRNLGDPYAAASDYEDLLRVGRQVLVYGTFYPTGEESRVEAARLVFLHRAAEQVAFERPQWWVEQADRIAGFYRRAEFGAGPVDYREYRTVLRLGGDKTDDHVQETDTISRLAYGMASAYLLTGNDDYLEVAERGVGYLREHMRFCDPDEGVVYWYHGILVSGGQERKLFTSEFADDYDAVPMYEQIYALAGLVQTYRVSGDPVLRADIDSTLDVFDRFFRDDERGGYFSHLDPITMSPRHPSLGPNRARKNWNSIGDHAPAYLINLYLATGESRYAEMLERTYDTVVEHFPDYAESPFVRERFHEDWSPDRTHAWQQDRAVVGHNLKIAWNLMRLQALVDKPQYRDLAEHIGHLMPGVGADRRRGGWYDVLERLRRPGEPWHRFAWHDRKAWWQQEQAILAYLLLAGVTGRDEYLAEARTAAAFYNAFFLDHDEGGVYFNVLASGIPYLLGTERLKGSHSMSMYHSVELCYLSAVYTHLLLRGHPLDLWFKPLPDADRLLRVAPDLLPPGAVRLAEVEIDGCPYRRFDQQALTVTLPDAQSRLTVRVRIVPARPAGKGAGTWT